MTGFILCFVVLLALHILTPFWWWVMLIPFLFGLSLARTGWQAFRTGALAAGLLWLGASSYFFLTGSALIASRIAAMMGAGPSWLMIFVSGMAAGAAAGLAGYAGYTVRALFMDRRRDKGQL